MADSQMPGAQALAEALVMRRMAQSSAAKAIGCSAGFLNHLLQGHKTPGLALAVRIQRLFGVHADTWGPDQ